ncbi:MAG: phosphate ABC transporter permease subunit PstC [Spirochaetales bacterium]
MIKSKNFSLLLRKEYAGRTLVMLCGISIVLLTVLIGIFLTVRGIGTFTKYNHSISEFLFSSEWKPVDHPTEGGGQIGSAVYIFGSLVTCALALLIATPFSIAAAVFMSDISPKFGAKIVQPALEIFVGIPSIVYGWVGLTVLVPFIRDHMNAPMGGYSVLAAGIVLAVMIFPTITTVATDAFRNVPMSYRSAAFALGSTRWQVIKNVVVPAAKPGILTGIILGLSRAFGEALAVAMVLGRSRVFPQSILHPTSNLTAAIASDMGNATVGGELESALWTMALLLFLISIFFIFIIQVIAKKSEVKYT